MENFVQLWKTMYKKDFTSAKICDTIEVSLNNMKGQKTYENNKMYKLRRFSKD